MRNAEAWGNTGMGLYEYEPLKDFPYDPTTGTTKTGFTSTQVTMFTKIMTPAQASAASTWLVGGHPARKLTVDEYNYYYLSLKNRTDLPLYAQVALAENLLDDLKRVYPNNPDKQRDAFLEGLAARKAELGLSGKLDFGSDYAKEKQKFIDLITKTNLEDPTKITASESAAYKNMSQWGASIQSISQMRLKKLEDEKAEAQAKYNEEMQTLQAKEGEEWGKQSEVRFDEYVKSNLKNYFDAILKTNLLAPYLTKEHKLLNEEVTAMLTSAVGAGSITTSEALKTYGQAIINLMRPLPKEIILPDYRKGYVARLLTEKLDPYQIPLLGDLSNG